MLPKHTLFYTRVRTRLNLPAQRASMDGRSRKPRRLLRLVAPTRPPGGTARTGLGPADGRSRAFEEVAATIHG